MGPPRPCSLPSAQVRHARTAGDAAQAGWARHRRACKASVRAERCAASIRPYGTLKGGRLRVGAHTPRARVHAARMRETSATRTPLISRVENSLTGLTLCATSQGEVPRCLPPLCRLPSPPARRPAAVWRPLRRRALGGTACVEEKGRLKCLSTFWSILWRLPWPTLGAGERFAARKIPSCAGVEVCIRKISLRLMEEAIHG